MVKGWLKTIDSIGTWICVWLDQHLFFFKLLWFNRFDSRWFEFDVSRLELHQRREILWLVRLLVDLTFKSQAVFLVCLQFLLSSSLRLFERDHVPVCFRWICRLDLRWWWFAWWTRVSVMPNGNAWSSSRPRFSLGLLFVGPLVYFFFLYGWAFLIFDLDFFKKMAKPSTEKKEKKKKTNKKKKKKKKKKSRDTAVMRERVMRTVMVQCRFLDHSG